MKTVTYRLIDGTEHTVEYDENGPCWSCGEPVTDASVGGTAICPWCDMGRTRDGRRWNLQETLAASRRRSERRAR